MEVLKMRLSFFFKIFALIIFLQSPAWAHFLTLLTDDFYIKQPKKPFELKVMFTHPIEQGPHMPFGIEESAIICGASKNVLSFKSLNSQNTAYMSTLIQEKPAICQLYVKQKPYFEKTESRYIQQIAKGIFSHAGLEEGWDSPLGLPVEIIPQVKPFALYEGNTFKGRVLINGKPAENIEVEIEFWNSKGLKTPHEGFIPQVVKTDKEGYFEYTFPWAGLWGFSAITEAGVIKGENGKEYPLELDGVFWVKVYPKPMEKRSRKGK